MEAARPENGWVIGIDVGGTKIAAGAVDVVSGLVRERHEVPTRPENGAESVGDTIAALAASISERLRQESQVVNAIGVGLPELVGPDGFIASNALVDWRHSGLQPRLERIAPTVVTSDVRAGCSGGGDARRRTSLPVVRLRHHRHRHQLGHRHGRLATAWSAGRRPRPLIRSARVSLQRLRDLERVRAGKLRLRSRDRPPVHGGHPPGRHRNLRGDRGGDGRRPASRRCRRYRGPGRR